MSLKRHQQDDHLPGRIWLFIGFLSSLLFLFYGSLVPLEFTHVPIEQALAAFREMLSMGLQIGSRIDAGENFILMVPAGFFGMGLVWPSKKRLWSLAYSVAMLMFCICASAFIEFAQIFFSGRTPSVSDIFMQSCGASTGIILWWLWGNTLWIRFFSPSGNRAVMGFFEKILWLYLIIMFLYNAVPLDLTINPFGIYQKYKAGQIILTPFSYHYNNAASFIYGIATDIAIWVPVGVLGILTKGKKPLRVWAWVLSAATLIEIAQIFISSRFFDVTDILMGGAGGGGGILLCLKIPYLNRLLPTVPQKEKGRYRLIWLGAGGFCIYFLFLVSVFWFPYDFKIQRDLFESQLQRFFQVPFYVYYTSGGLTAITAVLQKAIFFAPLGACLAIAAFPLMRSGINSLLALIGIMMCAGAGLIIELGQTLIPNKVPDSTDLLFETIGGGLGYWLVLEFHKRLNGFQSSRPEKHGK